MQACAGSCRLNTLAVVEGAVVVAEEDWGDRTMPTRGPVAAGAAAVGMQSAKSREERASPSAKR